MSYRKTDLGTPRRSKSAKVVLDIGVLIGKPRTSELEPPAGAFAHPPCKSHRFPGPAFLHPLEVSGQFIPETRDFP